MDLSLLEPIGHPALGIFIPLGIFLFASFLTWLLYRHFSSRK